MKNEKDKTSASWFNEARYGLFIHWGAYSVGGRGEWFMNRELITKEEYTKSYVEKWKAENYRPEEWLRLAKTAGMGYAILTARHHDGFALWNSQTNDFNAANLGPKRNLVAPYVEACRSAGLKVGLYYSPASWTHPDYPGAFFRDWPSENDWESETTRKRFIEFYRSELRELLSNYGKIDYLWFDGCIPENLEGDETLKFLRSIQPEIIVNNRLGDPYDVKCCEQTINPPDDPEQNWEACMTLNKNWGYHAGDSRWKNELDVIELLLKCAESAGNLLLNVGPKPDGSIPAKSIEIMRGAGEWIKRNFNAISNSEHHPFSWNCTARPVTSVGNTVFLHFLVDPKGSFCWGELKNKVLNAYFNDSGEKIRFRQENGRLFLTDIPNPLPTLPATIALELDGEPKASRRQTTFWIPE
jgi:alpha-L-fucosidase